MSEYLCLNPLCKAPFKPERPWQKYCCDRCRYMAWLLRRFVPREEVTKKLEDLRKKIEALEEELKPLNMKIKKDSFG